MWANPPFDDLKKVVTKACLEPCKIILVAPNWNSGNWKQLLGKVATHVFEIPPHIPVFERSKGEGLLPGKHWSIQVSVIDTTTLHFGKGDLDPLLVQEIENDSKGWGPDKLMFEMRSYPNGGGTLSKSIVIDRVSQVHW